MREFSIEHFQDTKVFEQISGMVVKIIRRFDSKQKGKDGKEILAEYLHFGDIDAGGYEIYENLCRKTGIPFGMYFMNLETLQKYESYARQLTENDKKRLKKLLEKQDCEYRDVLKYMLEKNIKLEQECIVF
ncbi:Wadjet anti-phage system protein JetD domain-containing protein [Anaerostipes sp.]|uniref:Wadjet anti-phage system protein JetD domain-containing protein n=1 Tax=Anaerostipes sp. TaxID=1872530 RepID=UPI002590DBDE|nr:Wadjet anti-phage system protein JetD domain-containing protein [Anaerostipes sp.]MCI5622346.1 DUF2220 domain-containing protein [Anaerostipes sp.]MDY2725944.1 DUF2220 family protein [Anaerostipes faecalis]